MSTVTARTRRSSDLTRTAMDRRGTDYVTQVVAHVRLSFYSSSFPLCLLTFQAKFASSKFKDLPKKHRKDHIRSGEAKPGTG
jgi:hypothetical protein